MGVKCHGFLVVLSMFMIISIREVQTRTLVDSKHQKTSTLKHHLQNFLSKVKKTQHYLKQHHLHTSCISPPLNISIPDRNGINYLHRLHLDVILLEKLFDFALENQENFASQRIKRLFVADIVLAKLVLKHMPSSGRNKLKTNNFEIRKVRCENGNASLFHLVKQVYRRIHKTSENMLHQRL